MRQRRSHPASTETAQPTVRAVESMCECRCDPLSQEGACLLSPPFQTALGSQEHYRKRKGISLTARQQPWHRMRSGVLFALACLTSPCCTPIMVPLVLSLLTGTPAALWLTLHGGWVYGVLTGVSLLSAVLGLYWMRTPARRRRPGARSKSSSQNPGSSPRPSDQEALGALSDKTSP